MVAQARKEKSSKTSLLKTIESDLEASRWFYLLLTSPGAAGRVKSDKKTALLLSKTKTYRLFQGLLTAVQLLLLVHFYSSRNPADIVLFLVCYFAASKLEGLNGLNIARLSRVLLDADYTRHNFADLTFFQVCEFYSKKYTIPSFVDVSFNAETVLRRFLILILAINAVLAIFIYEFSLVKLLLTTVIPYLFFSSLLKTTLVIRWLDKYFKSK